MKISFATLKQNKSALDSRIGKIETKGRYLQNIRPAKGRDDLVVFELEIDSQMNYLAGLKRSLRAWAFKKEIFLLKFDEVLQNVES